MNISTMPRQHFYLVGDDVATVQAIQVDTTWKLEDLKRAVGLVFHVAQPMGECDFPLPTGGRRVGLYLSLIISFASSTVSY